MYALIINPRSGNGRGLRELPRIEALLRAEGIPYRSFHTTEPGDSRKYAARAVAEKMEGIIALGGDGTLFEIINGMGESSLTLLFACCGTGNDFIKSFGLPKDPVAALRLQLHAPARKIDIGRMNDTYFLNVSGTGLDVDVLLQAEKHKARHTGLSAYLRGVRDAIHLFRPMCAQVSIDGAPSVEERFSILSVGNGQYFGGGMRPVPNAVVNDGLFNVVITRPVKKWMIGFLMALFVPGWYTKTGLCRTLTCRSIRISSPGMTLNLDGELIPCDDAQYRLIPAALTVRIPALARQTEERPAMGHAAAM